MSLCTKLHSLLTPIVVYLFHIEAIVQPSCLSTIPVFVVIKILLSPQIILMIPIIYAMLTIL
jgi:hypothetical protein